MSGFTRYLQRRGMIAALVGAVSLLAAAETTFAQQFQPQTPLGAPILAFGGTQTYQANGKVYVRYCLPVVNRQMFPNHLFEWTGARKNPSRTWVHVLDQRGRRLYGFTALRSAQDLGQIWFSVKLGERPPTAVYIELRDRLTGRRYRSNLVLLRRFP